MKAAGIELHADEQQRANQIVRQLAKRLGIPFGAEVLANGLLVYALDHGWRIDVYLELPDEHRNSPTGLWVLILSRSDVRSYRAFSGDDVEPAARHVRRFLADGDYRQRCLSEAGPRQRGRSAIRRDV